MKHQFFLTALVVNLIIFQNLDAQVNVSIRAHLQGALMGVSTSPALMRDNLRQKRFIPVQEPYSVMQGYPHLNGSGGETISDTSIFQKTGPDALVDWVFVEIRDPNAPQKPIAIRSALIQRDGDVVDTDGASPLKFTTLPSGKYYVVLRHRNHLGVMTAYKMQLSANSELIDFTDPSFETFGWNPQVLLGNKMALWAGDLTNNKQVNYDGPGNEVLSLLTEVMTDPDNTSESKIFIKEGYSISDIDLDGNTIFQGPGSDREKLLFQVSLSWLNNYCTPSSDPCVLKSQVP